MSLKQRIFSLFSGRADYRGLSNLGTGQVIQAVEWARTADDNNSLQNSADLYDAEGLAPPPFLFHDEVPSGNLKRRDALRAFPRMAEERWGDTFITKMGGIMLPFTPHLFGLNNHGFCPPNFVVGKLHENSRFASGDFRQDPDAEEEEPPYGEAAEQRSDDRIIPIDSAVIMFSGDWSIGQGVVTFGGLDDGSPSSATAGDYAVGVVTARLENGLYLIQVSGVCRAFGWVENLVTYSEGTEDEVVGSEPGYGSTTRVYPKQYSSTGFFTPSALGNAIPVIAAFYPPEEYEEGKYRVPLLVSLGASGGGGGANFISFSEYP